MSKFFEIVAPVYDRLHIGASSTFRNLGEVAEFKSTDVVLDIGGGTGRISGFFIGKVREVIVVDPSLKMVEQCRKRNGIKCLVGGAEKLPIEDRSVDKIILVDAFHHLPDQAAAVSEMKRVLAGGGQIIIEEFNPQTFGGKLIVLSEWILRMGSKFHAPKDLAKMFEDNGFKVRISCTEKKSYYLLADR